MHQVVIDGINYNMASLVQSGKYVVINTTDTATNGFYVIKFKSEAYKLQDNKTVDGKIITAGGLVAKTPHLFLCKKSLIGFGINIPNRKLLNFQHAQYFTHNLMIPQ